MTPVTWMSSMPAYAPVLIVACALTQLFAPHLALRGASSAVPGARGGWIAELALAALMTVSLATGNGALAFGATAAMSLVIGIGAWRLSRTAGVALLVSALLLGGAAAAIGTGNAAAAFWLSLLAFVLRVGIFPFQGGVAALTDRSLPLLLQQLATLPTSVFVHMRYVDPATAAEWAPAVVLVGALSTLAFALISLAQRSLHGLLRASVLMHGGMLFAAVGAAGQGHYGAAILVAVNLGLALSGFGIMLRSLEARVGPLTPASVGGLARAFPRLAVGVAVFGGAAVGLPGTAGFIADDLLLHGLWQTNMPSAVLVILASALLAVATLAGFARTFWGAPQRRLAPDLGSGERLAVAGLVVWLLVLGFVPRVLVA